MDALAAEHDADRRQRPLFASDAPQQQARRLVDAPSDRPGPPRDHVPSRSRDLEVEIPGHGHDKINSTLPLGGPQLTIRTFREALGVEVNHVILLDMTSFREVIDALDGIEVDVRKPARTKVECPYPSAARCARWKGWSFGRGRQE